jgi:hypothetical protein
MPDPITASAFNALVTSLILALAILPGEMHVVEPWLVPLHRAR